MLRRSNAGNGQYTTFSAVFSSRGGTQLNLWDACSPISVSNNYSIESGNTLAAVNPTFANNIPDWYLLTLVNNQSNGGKMSLYKNNSSISSSIDNASISSNTYNLRIGGDAYGGGNFKGDMGAFLFYNRVLTLSEIAQNYYSFAKRFNI
jgi:hypothetical protein